MPSINSSALASAPPSAWPESASGFHAGPAPRARSRCGEANDVIDAWGRQRGLMVGALFGSGGLNAATPRLALRQDQQGHAVDLRARLAFGVCARRRSDRMGARFVDVDPNRRQIGRAFDET